MEKFRIYGERSEKPSQLELANRQLAQEAAAEGMVLLKNDGVLPLKEKEIALYGAGARLTVKGGSGSGDVRERYSVSIEEGLKNAGFTILSASWLERFTKEYEEDVRAFHERVEDAIKGYRVWQVMAMFQKIGEFKLAYPVGGRIEKEDIVSADTAVYVVARQAGEGDDRKIEGGDFLLSQAEIENIDICVKNYKHVVLVVNCGGILDISPVADKVSAVIYYGQAGEEGGNALGKLLCGEYNFSGKLADTWGRNYSDYPTAAFEQSEKLQEDYHEGIYVGYRWFEAKGVAPLYPFGFGLSYTTFESKFIKAECTGGRVSLTVRVKNTGASAGKQVVQAYISRPNNKYFGEKKLLAAFNKTRKLFPGDEAELTLKFDLADCAVYDEAIASFVLEEGDYPVYIGEDSASVIPCVLLRVKGERIVEKCKNLCVKKRGFKEISFDIKAEEAGALPIAEVGEIPAKEHSYNYTLPAVSSKVRKYLDGLSDEELAMFCMGGGYFTKRFNRVEGACGNTTSRLVKKGIPNIIMADGPAGVNILQKAAFTKSGYIRYVDELPKDWQWGWLKKVIPKLKFLFAKSKHTHVYQYCTAWPNATTIAQTWNVELASRVGLGIGKEMLKMGVTLWLAPALNIHRDPLCGRNFEYYSEDPLISGQMAAAVTRGVQSVGGVGVTIKHFACNNRENNRMEVSSNLSERALREIYLRGFRMACRENPMALMSSYNKINGVYAPNNRELLTDILRCEWGYNGLVMSDWDAVDKCSYIQAIKCGNNMIMPGRKDIYEKLVQAIAAGELTREEIKFSAAYALNAVFSAATSKGF